MTSANVNTLRRLLETFSGADAEALAQGLDEVLIPQFVMHGSALCPFAYGRDAVKQRALALKTSFPDVVVRIEQLFSEGTKVMVHAQVAGTHKREWQGIAATGTRVMWTMTGIMRFNDQGKAVEGWMIEDSLGLLQQLGRVPLISGQPRPPGS